MTSMRVPEDPHITLVPGFRASAVSCGLKPGSELDLALIAADVPCVPAAVFTTNQVQAAPVVYDRQLMDGGGMVQAVVINSGCANACTGARGLRDAAEAAALVEAELSLSAGSVLVMSTGVIGQYLAMDRVRAGIRSASRSLSAEGGHAAARAIMTTDTVPKEASVRVDVAGQDVTIAGMCKGSGMIHPNMATMLGVIATDVAIERPLLQRALDEVVGQTFNMVTVDGDTSTNDAVALLANGLAANEVISDEDSAAYRAFRNGLLEVATSLATALARDGEGASKFITIRVTGATDAQAATVVAKSIADSALVKTAVYGQDANWGRVLCAAGYSGVAFDPAQLALWLTDGVKTLHLVRNGEPFEIDETVASEILASREIAFRLDLGQGSGEARVWTCDLTHDYVSINAHYRT
ncbi:MAG TPA: bifunctional glutamate N-acetyltransferase/amino-acid acetyltransferase ArgJ [Anaerolineae bacterium]|nr:bifunctional glutamate N-acetyltransferase/amino-acid acetyltransferase ArgJ [Anaerolineae bacterium]